MILNRYTFSCGIVKKRRVCRKGQEGKHNGKKMEWIGYEKKIYISEGKKWSRIKVSRMQTIGRSC
jgi:hypothetical protein